MRKLLTIAEFKQQAAGGDGPSLANAVRLYKSNIVVLGIHDDDDDDDDKSGLIRINNITASDDSVDRENDTIRADGWKLANFKRNPVILWAHMARNPPIARATRTEVIGNKLQQDFEFTPEDMQHPMGMGFGHTVGRMFQKGFLNAVSVGFAPLLWQFDEDRGGIDFLEQELLETSPVTIPANPNALVDAGKQLVADGVDLSPVYEWAERCLDGDDGLTIVVPRKNIELTHTLLAKSLGKAERTFVDLGANTPDPDDGAKDEGKSAVTELAVQVNVEVVGGKSIAEQAKAATEARANIERDAVQSILDGAAALSELGSIGDTERFTEAMELMAQIAERFLPDDDSGGGTDPDPGDQERTITIVAGKAKLKISHRQLEDLFDHVGKTTEETIAQLTGRLPH